MREGNAVHADLSRYLEIPARGGYTEDRERVLHYEHCLDELGAAQRSGLSYLETVPAVEEALLGFPDGVTYSDRSVVKSHIDAGDIAEYLDEHAADDPDTIIAPKIPDRTSITDMLDGLTDIGLVSKRGNSSATYNISGLDAGDVAALKQAIYNRKTGTNQ